MRVYILGCEREREERQRVAFRCASKLAIFPSRRDASPPRRRRRRSNLFGNSKSLGRNDGLGIKCVRQPSVFAASRPRNLSAGSPRASDGRGRVIRHQKVSIGRSTDFGSRLPGRVWKSRLSPRKITILLRSYALSRGMRREEFSSFKYPVKSHCLILHFLRASLEILQMRESSLFRELIRYIVEFISGSKLKI